VQLLELNCGLLSSSFLDKDGNNYMAYFKRATVFLAMGRIKQAARDLDQVLELKPDFDNVRGQNFVIEEHIFHTGPPTSC